MLSALFFIVGFFNIFGGGNFTQNNSAMQAQAAAIAPASTVDLATTALFTNTGAINPVAASELGRIVRARNHNLGGTTSHTQATLRNSDWFGGNLMLFNSTTTLGLTTEMWEPVFLRGNILTLWISRPFGTHTIPSGGAANFRSWVDCTSRTAITSAANALVNARGGSNGHFRQAIVYPINAQNNMNNSGDSGNNGTSAIPISQFGNDLFWTPSPGEIMNNGLWGFPDNASRVRGGFPSTISGNSRRVTPLRLSTTSSQRRIGGTGAIEDSAAAASTRALRPAIHLDLRFIIGNEINASFAGDAAGGETITATATRTSFRQALGTPAATFANAVPINTAGNDFTMSFYAGAGRTMQSIAVTVGTQTITVPVSANRYVTGDWVTFTGGRVRAFVQDIVIGPGNEVPERRAMVVFENINSNVNAVGNVVRTRGTNSRLASLGIIVNGVARPFIDTAGSEIPFTPNSPNPVFVIEEVGAAITQVVISGNAQCNGPDTSVGRPVCVCGDSFCQGATVVGLGNQAITGTENIFTVTVTAEDESTQTVYTIMIGRQDLCDNAHIQALNVLTVDNVPVTLTEGTCTTTGNMSFSARVENTIRLVHVTVETESPYAIAEQGGAGAWSLSIGENTREVVIRSQRGDTKTHILNIYVERDADQAAAVLHGLWITGGAPFEAPFASGTPHTAGPFVANAPFAVEVITVHATPRGQAMVEMMHDGHTSFESLRALEINLSVGRNTVIVRVTSADGTTTADYVVHVDRGAASIVARLASLGGTDLNINNFDPSLLDHTVSVPYETRSTLLFATPECQFASVSVQGGTITGIVWLTQLATGQNTFLITVQSECGQHTTEYTLIIIRTDVPGEGPIPPTAVDLAALLDAINMVGAYIITDGHRYTTISVTVMQGAVDHGQGVLNNPLSQAQVRSATQRILDAHAARVLLGGTPPTDVDKTALQGLVNTAIQFMNTHRELLTVASGRAIDDGIRVGIAVLENDFASQAQVNVAFDNLERALSGFQLRQGTCPFPTNVDRAALLALMNQVRNHLNNPVNRSRYTLASINLIDSAMQNAVNAFWDVASTQLRIDLARTQLQNAFNARQERGGPGDTDVNKASLIALIEYAKARMIENPTTYTVLTANAVMTAVSYGQAIVDDPTVTQAIVNVAYAELRAALDNLRRVDGRDNNNNGGGAGGIWGRLANVWTGLPWVLFVALPILLLLIILAIVLAIVITRKRRANEEDELDANGVPVYKARLSELRMKARDAVNKAFSELKYAGECVTYCDSYYSQESEKTAMDQLTKTDKAMINAEECVMTYLAEKRAQENKNQKGKKKKKRAEA